MHRMILLLFALAVAGCANEPRSRDVANPDVAGRTLAMQVCSNCHGIAGVAHSPNFPNLAAQQEAYLVAQLKGFRAHSRRDPAGFEYMWGLSHHLTDAQIHDLAAYFAAQPPANQPLEGKAARIAAGKSIFEHGLPAPQSVPPCASCHGADGGGRASFPRLAGQHLDYLVKQLTVFQRTNERPEGSVMKVVAHSLTRDNIENVAAYLQSMPHH
jgi:cytochrome c553